MATRKEIEVALKGKDDGAGGVVDSLRQRIRALKAEAKASGEADVEKLIKNPGKAAGFIARNLGAGLGTFVAIEAVKGIGEMAEKFSEFKRDVDAGNRSWDEMPGEIAKSLPLIGGAVSGIEKLMFAVAGVTDNTKEMTAAQAAAAAAFAKQKEFENVFFGLGEKLGDAKKESRRQSRDAGTTDEKQSAVNAEEDRHNDKLAAIGKARAEAQKLVGESRAEVERQIADAELAEATTHQDKLARVDQDFAKRKADADKKAQDQTEDLQAEAREKKARAEGKDLEAELIAIDRAAARTKAGLTKKEDRDAVDQGAESDKAQARADAKKREAEHSSTVERTLEAAKIADLEAHADDSLQAKRAAMKAKSAAESAARIRDLQKIVDDAKATEHQKNLAREEIVNEQSREKKKETALDQFDPDAGRQRAGVGATLLNDRFHDIAGQFRDGREPGLVEQKNTSKNTAKSAVHLETIAAGIAELVRKNGSPKGRSLFQ